MSSLLRKWCILYSNPNAQVLCKPARAHHNAPESGLDPEIWEPAHRLDFETSGCLLFAKKEFLAPYRSLFQTVVDGGTKIQKLYLAGLDPAPLQEDPFLRGKLEIYVKNAELIRGYNGTRYRHSKKAKFSFSESDLRGYHSIQETQHRLLPNPDLSETKDFKGAVYCVELKSGSRHQIRSFFKSLGCPILGDPLYNPPLKNQSVGRMELHAWKLSWKDPFLKTEEHAQAPYEP